MPICHVTSRNLLKNRDIDDMPIRILLVAMGLLTLAMVVSLWLGLETARRGPDEPPPVAQITLGGPREPDAQLGFVLASLTMGQVLSVPLVLFGGFLVLRIFLSPERHELPGPNPGA